MESSIFGVSVREAFLSSLQARRGELRAIEVVFENYLFTQGERRVSLQQWGRDFFIHLHGVTTNIGSWDPLNVDNLDGLKLLIQETRAQLVSDHLCFTRIGGQSTFDLFPIPRTRRMVDHVGHRLDQIRDRLGTDFLLENISSYFTYHMDEMTELEFMIELHQRYGARYLFDLNNLFVSAQNLGFSAESFVEELPRDSVAAYHLGGYEMVGGFLFDTHGAGVSPDVEILFRRAVKRFGHRPAFLERDENIPHQIEVLEKEIGRIAKQAGYDRD